MATAWVLSAHPHVSCHPTHPHPLPLPLQEEVKAAADRGEVMPTVGQDLRLDNRFLDLRTPANQAIFKVQSAVCQVSDGRARARRAREGGTAWVDTPTVC